MDIGEVCSRDVYTVRGEEPLANAAREMRTRNIGSLVVVESRDAAVRPVGIVTDRDIVCGQVSRGADLFCLTVADVMTPHPLTVAETSGIAEAIGQISDRAVRRAPVVNATGGLVGIVSVDDLLPVLAKELGALAKLVGGGAKSGR